MPRSAGGGRVSPGHAGTRREGTPAAGKRAAYEAAMVENQLLGAVLDDL